MDKLLLRYRLPVAQRDRRLSGGRSCRIAAEEPTVADEALWTDGQHELTYVVRDVISAR